MPSLFSPGCEPVHPEAIYLFADFVPVTIISHKMLVSNIFWQDAEIMLTRENTIALFFRHRRRNIGAVSRRFSSASIRLRLVLQVIDKLNQPV